MAARAFTDSAAPGETAGEHPVRFPWSEPLTTWHRKVPDRGHCGCQSRPLSAEHRLQTRNAFHRVAARVCGWLRQERATAHRFHYGLGDGYAGRDGRLFGIQGRRSDDV